MMIIIGILRQLAVCLWLVPSGQTVAGFLGRSSSRTTVVSPHPHQIVLREQRLAELCHSHFAVTLSCDKLGAALPAPALL